MVIGNKSQMIANILAEKISSGELVDRLPAEQELAKQFGVSPVTAAKALNILRDRGVVKRVARWGTFVVPREKTLLKIRFSDGSMAAPFMQYLSEKFPDVEIEQSFDFESVDAAVCPSTLPFFPGEYFLPWPRERISRLRTSGRFFPQVFEFFNLCGTVWSVPFCFSPDVLLYNKKIMGQISPGFEPYSTTYESLLELQKKLPEGVRFFAGRGEALMLSFIYDLSGEGCGGPEVYRKAVRMLSSFDLDGKSEDFCRGNHLFATGFRGRAWQLDSDFDVCPMPEVNGRRRCHTASQSFWVRNTTEHAALLFDIGESLFQEDFQKFICARLGNIPADAAVAVAGMDSRHFRDDIFFNEIKNMDFSHRHMLDSISSCFSGTMKNLVCGYISIDEFLEEIEAGFRFEEKRRNSLRFFLGKDA